MKKISLIALAVPALFAACSQEDIVSDVQNQSGEMSGKVAGDVTFVYDSTPETRMTWAPDGDAETAIQWNAKEGDAFSLFWVAGSEETVSENYQGKTNALYKSADGAEFKSENIIYEGNHVIVYPADYAHRSSKDIVVSVPEIQNAADDLGTKRTVAVSDLLTIKAPLTGDNAAESMAAEPNTIWADGYNTSLSHGSARVNVLSSHMVLNLNFDLKKLEEVEVRSVKLVADKAVFATAGNLEKNQSGFTSLKATNTSETVTLNIGSVKVNKENNSYMAQISLLPPVLDNVDAAYSIVVETNYGMVTINKALDVTNSSGKAQFKPFEVDGEDGTTVAGEANATTPLSFYTEFTNIATRAADNPATANVNESEESYGKRIVRYVNVDMSKASIKNWPVNTSEELIAAYEIYDNLDRGNSETNSEETFVLNPTWGPCFELTPEAYDEVAKHPNVTLAVADDVTEIKLIPGDDRMFEKIPDLAAINRKKELMLLVRPGNTWTLNVEDAALANQWKWVDNQAALTVVDENVDTDNYTGEDLAVELITGDGGQTTFNLDYPLTVKYTEHARCSTIVPEGYTLALEGDGNTFNGTLEVNGRVIVNRNLTTLNSTTNVYGSLLTTANGQLNNGENATINIKSDAASAIVNENYGTIELNNRNNSAVVKGDNQGYIKWTYSGNGTLTRSATDAFNYVRLSSDVTLTSNSDETNVQHIKFLEITGSKVKVTSNKTSDTQVVNGIFIGKNCTMLVPIGTTLTTTSVSGGFVEVYGNFNYTDNNGTVIYDMSETTEESLRAMIADGGVVRLKNDVTLTSNLEISGDVTINLDGKTLTLGNNKITNNGNLTINKGNISASVEEAITSSGGSLTMTECNVNGVETVVYVTNGTATITGGKYNNTQAEPTTYGYCIGICGGTATINTSVNTETGSHNGGLTVQNATVLITGGTYYGNSSISQYGLHVANGANVTYESGVNFDNCYVQVKSETPGNAALPASTVNTAEFSTENIQDYGFVGTKDQLNTKIEEILNPVTEDQE